MSPSLIRSGFHEASVKPSLKEADGRLQMPFFFIQPRQSQKCAIRDAA